MAINLTLNYSLSFNPIKRKKNQIKFIIFHYTGMKKESAAINRLTEIQSQVSSHYIIKNDGDIVNLVPDLYTAWHAGISSWKNFNLLNKNSIGIEISNPGHEFDYKKFSIKQIHSLIKYKIDPKNILGHSDISPDRKKDPGEKFPWEYLAKNKIGLWHKLKKRILKNARKNNIDHLSQKIFLNNIYKMGYSKKNGKKIEQKKYEAFVIKAFQRRYRRDLVDGKIDQECLLISENLLKKHH